MTAAAFFWLLELPLQGALSVMPYTQGDALGYGELPLRGAQSTDKRLYKSLRILNEQKKELRTRVVYALILNSLYNNRLSALSRPPINCSRYRPRCRAVRW